ncbi:MFS transporter [Streptomyces sp. NRRL S-118]|uniref:MFS transporter n=1 Tax=Streptomyces sp. NRRL S-118 TaxID=1463881 RepID=UPI00099BFBBC|nr:MFS transporter [Streptomyces sp. NRRL S-118]
MPYRSVLTRPVLAWGAVTIAARLPVAMAPLALVFLVRERPGGYSLGAVLAAVYVVGEILGAPVFGTRLRPERARPQLAAGLVGGGVAFAGLGLAPQAPPVVLGVLAFVAGGAPGAVSGGMRALLTGMVPAGAVGQAISLESVLTSAVWAVAPALTTWLALGAAPYVPLLLAGGLMGAAVAGLWALPAGWAADDGDRGGVPMRRLLARAWPVYVTGAASLTLLALAELVLPALLEQRSLGLGWAGPLLAGFSLGSAAGAFVYGLRGWPGRLAVQSVVLLLGVSGCVALVALLPWTGAIAAGLVVAGVLQAGAMVTRNMRLREVLPASALAAGYAVMYAAIGAGYAASGTLAGGLLRVVSPSTAILAGVGLTLVLTAIGAVGERRLASGVRDAAGDAAGDTVGAEGAPVDGRRDPERSL